jgi:hypothetical protein
VGGRPREVEHAAVVCSGTFAASRGTPAIAVVRAGADVPARVGEATS